ncbi:Uncharacterised protein g3043 [Pycnogonum litorale]
MKNYFVTLFAVLVLICLSNQYPHQLPGDENELEPPTLNGDYSIRMSLKINPYANPKGVVQLRVSIEKRCGMCGYNHPDGNCTGGGINSTIPEPDVTMNAV